MAAGGTPVKQFERTILTPRTKARTCIICDKFVQDDRNKKLIFRGSTKTVSCLNIEQLLRIEVVYEHSLDYVCRACDTKIASTISKVETISTQFEQTSARLRTITVAVTKRQLRSPQQENIPISQTEHSSRRPAKKSLLQQFNPEKGTKSVYCQTITWAEDPCSHYKTSSVQIVTSYPNSQAKKVQLRPELETLGRQLAHGTCESVVRAFLGNEDLHQCLINHISKLISRELDSFCSPSEPSVLRLTGKEDLKEFTWEKVKNELLEKALSLWNILKGVNRSDVQEIPLLDIVCKLASLHNRKMCAVKHIKSIILKKGGTKKICFGRLNRTGDCLSYQQSNNILEAYGRDYTEKINMWKGQVEEDTASEARLVNSLSALNPPIQLTTELNLQLDELEKQLTQLRDTMFPGYSFTSDNVDVRFKVRHMTQSRQNRDHHLFHLISYKNRISGNHLSDSGRVADPTKIPIATFLPTLDDNNCLIDEFVFLIGQVWVEYIPSLSWFKEYLPRRRRHEYHAQMSTKTEKIHLGVLEKNEQKLEDMVDICRFLHQFVPGNCVGDADGPDKHVKKTLSGGDYLTFERHKTAQSRQQDGRTPSRRLEGLQPKMEDFHQQAEWLAVLAWNQLYKTSSKADIGTLHAARCAIQSRNVTSDPRQCFYAASELMDKFTNAYLVSGAMDHFGMADVKSEVTKNGYTGSQLDKVAKQEYVQNVIRDFVVKHIMCKIPSFPPNAPRTSEFKCSFCNKVYKQIASLRKHERDTHNFHPKQATEAIPLQKADHKYNYTRTALLIGMLMRNHNDAICHGDGEHVIRLYKYFTLFYKAQPRSPKYAYGTFETLAQIHCLLSPRMSHRLTWNRFVNYRGKQNTNFPMDLDVEHANKAFKDEVHSYRGEVTQKTIDRISLSLNFTEHIVKAYDNTTLFKRPSGQHKDIDKAEDVLSLATQFHSAKLFQYIPDRCHRSFPTVKESPLDDLDMEKLWVWMANNIKEHSSKPYYAVPV